MTLVLDASVTLRFCFPDEVDEAVESIFETIQSVSVLVPEVWWFETRNALLVAERRGRIDRSDTDSLLAYLSDIPVRIDRNPDEESLLLLARDHLLTVYDAAYLELAERHRSALATLDGRLLAAARRIGVPLFNDAG